MHTLFTRKSAVVAALTATAALTIAACGGSSGSPADTIYVNAKVLTVDSHDAVAQAFAVKDGKFLAVGSRAEIDALASLQTKVVDLGGRTVVPGLTDGHLHGAGGGPGIDLSKTRTIQDVLSKIAAAVAKASPGEILQSNSDWHEAQLKEVRMPTLAELDGVAPDNPVVLHRGGLTALINSAALKKWNITAATVSPPGGLIGTDAVGNPTGLLINNARSLMTLPPPPAFGVEALLDFQHKLNSLGITTVRVPGMFTGTTVPQAYKLIRQLQSEGRLTLRYQLLLNSMAPVNSAAEVQSIMSTAKLAQGEGDDWARIWGVKTSVDGGFEGGYMSRPYSEPYGRNGTFFGLPLVTASAYESVSREWAKNGYRVAVHVVGDAALDQVLDAWEKIDREKPGTVRGWTIEHAFIVRPAQLDRVKALGLNLSVQAHLYVAAPVLSRYWGHDRAEHVTPVRTFIDRGFRLAGGSDSGNMPVNPFWAMYHFITRDTVSDGIYGIDERATRTEVLRMFTIHNAELNGEAATKGSIEAGKLADFAVLSGDFLTVPDAAVADLRAVATYVSGRQVYRDPSVPVPPQ
jgi:predicted amidohydrolase YtcJ